MLVVGRMIQEWELVFFRILKKFFIVQFLGLLDCVFVVVVWFDFQEYGVFIEKEIICVWLKGVWFNGWYMCDFFYWWGFDLFKYMYEEVNWYDEYVV